MGHGLPDWYRGVDVAYQALSEMIVRPKYGSAIAAQGTVTISYGDEETLFTISGKGVTYGGYITARALNATALKAATLRLVIDGTQSVLSVVGTMMSRGAWTPTVEAFYITQYDEINIQFTAAVTPGFTFETSLSVMGGNWDANDRDFDYKIFYAVI